MAWTHRRKPKGQSKPRKFRGKARSSKKKSVISRPVNMGKVFPDSVRVKLVETSVKNISTTTADTYLEYALNGLYDPDITGTGGQPVGFDQYASLYKNYRVMASSISVYYFNTENSAITQISIIPQLKRDNAIRTYLNPEQHKRCRYKRYANESGGGGRATGTVKHYCSMKSLSGNNLYKTESEYGPLVTANPGDDFLAMWYVLIQDPVNTGTSLHGQAIIKITYYAEFFNLKHLADS